MINLNTRELKYRSLINKHLENFKDKGFRLDDNYKLYCEFCEYSIKIDRKHVKNQMESHLRSQKHVKNQFIKIKSNQFDKKLISNFSNFDEISNQSTFFNLNFKTDSLKNLNKDNQNLIETNIQNSSLNLTKNNYLNKNNSKILSQTDKSLNVFKNLKKNEIFKSIELKNSCHFSFKNLSKKNFNVNKQENFVLDITQNINKDNLDKKNYFNSSTLNENNVNKLNEKFIYKDKSKIIENHSFLNSFKCLKQDKKYIEECNKSLKLSSNSFLKINKKQNFKLDFIKKVKCDNDFIYFSKKKSFKNQAPTKMLRKTFTSNVLKPSFISNNLFFSKLLKKDYSSNISTINEYESYKRLKIVEPCKHVMNVQFNRPDKANSIDVLMFEEIKDCFKKINRDKYFRSVILTAAGKIFCAGIDLHTFQGVIPETKTDPSRLALTLKNKITDIQECVLAIAQCQKPIVAAINGKCIGAGMNILAFVDVRYCSKDAMFCIKEVALGLAADIGALQGLPRMIGNQSFLREMVYTAKEVGPEEAKGLVSKICDNDETLYESALNLAKSIAKRSPIAVQGSKVCLDYSLDHSLVEGLNFSANWNMTMLQSDDIIKGSMSVLTKNEDKVEFDNL